MTALVVKISCKGLGRSSARVGSSIKGVVDNPHILPIYGNISCNINKKTKLTWWKIYSFSTQDIPEDKEDFKVCINIKRSQLHKVVAHPLVFPCVETID